MIMAPDYRKPPYSFFAPPGTVRVSESALEIARRYADELRRKRPPSEWLLSFDWADERAVRRPSGGPLEELGPGLDLVAYDKGDVPLDVLQTVDGLTFAIKIAAHIYGNSVLRLIDTDDKEPSKLILR